MYHVNLPSKNGIQSAPYLTIESILLVFHVSNCSFYPKEESCEVGQNVDPWEDGVSEFVMVAFMQRDKKPLSISSTPLLVLSYLTG